MTRSDEGTIVPVTDVVTSASARLDASITNERRLEIMFGKQLNFQLLRLLDQSRDAGFVHRRRASQLKQPASSPKCT